MTVTSIDALLQIASAPLSPAVSEEESDRIGVSDLGRLLAQRNGFYAFESALHVFGVGSEVVGGSLEEWNRTDDWISDYCGLAERFLFFAEDVFGNQFCWRDGKVWLFDAETAQAEELASSIEEWASAILEDFEFLTGCTVAREWQEVAGPLAPSVRLIPKLPFVLGGTFSVDNLYRLDSAQGMRLRGDLAVQLRDLPDGSSVRFKVVD